MSIRTIYLKMTIDWEDYDDVIDELIIEDSGVLDSLKDGVSIEQIQLGTNPQDKLTIRKNHEKEKSKKIKN
jgi:hypothetical protein